MLWIPILENLDLFLIGPFGKFVRKKRKKQQLFSCLEEFAAFIFLISVGSFGNLSLGKHCGWASK